ncbi:uncharacterized protein M6B38_171055 [Iris pallida]|uniref:Pyroglutamyl-peptidase I n=1 Tax=Iris pallida TaxID=29817 RepID=A0AAX6DIP3_IRIPA|nr:Uncharacterized protein M6B38_243225 [Iris pallida]KAJ6807708.1 uncharacterized protein M6B38_171055 [Iris pallida]
MGSEGPSVVTFHVTGFKKFHGVCENPTETIVSNLEGYLQKNGVPKGLVLGSCNVLETAGEGALGELNKVFQSSVVSPDNESLNPQRVIWLHLGVNSGATRFAIETQAVNEATFRCPDELGWKPQASYDCFLKSLSSLLMVVLHGVERLLFLWMILQKPWQRRGTM